MKKVLSLFLSLVMLLSVTAGMTFSAQAVPKTKDVYLTVTAPSSGSETDKNENVTDSNGGTVLRVMWFDLNVSDWQTIGVSDTFIAGHKYRVTVKVKAPAGYIYDDKYGATDGYVNGAKGTVFKFSNDADDEIEVQYDFGACPQNYVPDTVLFTGRIYSGQPIDQNTYGLNYTSIEGFQLTAVRRNGQNIDIGSVATYGSYGVSMILTAKPGYAFTTKHTIRIDNKKFNPYLVSNDGKYAFVNADGIEIACPHAEATGEWQKDYDTHWKVCDMCGEEVQKSAHTYDSGVDKGNYILYTCSVCGSTKSIATADTEVSLLRMDDIPCIVGNVVMGLGFKGSDREKATITTTWYKGSVGGTALPAGTKFEAGQTYYAVLDINAKEHYYFNTPYGPSIQSSYADDILPVSTDVTARHVTATYTYTCVGAQPTTVTLPEVRLGLTIGDVLDGIGYQFNGSETDISVTFYYTSTNFYAFQRSGGTWSLAGGGDVNAARATAIEASSDYKLIIINNAYSYVAKKDVTVINEFGADYIINADSKISSITATYKTPSRYISTVSLSGIVPPVGGQYPINDFTLNNQFGVKKIALSWDADSAFECGKEYTATAVVQATDGYAFLSAAYATVEGCTGVSSSGSGDTLSVRIKFTTPEHTYNPDDAVVVAPTCTTAGTSTCKCVFCGEVKTESIKATGHTYISKITKAPTFKKAGVMTYTCVQGDDSYTKAVPKLKNTKVKKVKAAKKKMTVTLAKSAGVSGYQIQYATNKKFKKAKTVKIKKATTVKKTVKKLKSGKKYYIRVRAYKKIGKKTVYAKWAKYKKAVKVK